MLAVLTIPTIAAINKAKTKLTDQDECEKMTGAIERLSACFCAASDVWERSMILLQGMRTKTNGHGAIHKATKLLLTSRSDSSRVASPFPRPQALHVPEKLRSLDISAFFSLAVTARQI